MSLWGLTNLWLWGQGWFIHESNLLCVKIKCVSNPWFWSSDHWILILLHTFSKREPKIGGLQHWLLISLVSTWYMGFRVQISNLHFVRQTSQLDNLSSGIPNLVVQNDRISNYRLSILVAMPCPYCMCTVFYVKQSVAKACFSVCWIIWLRFCKPVKKDTSRFMLCIWV
jgi:hypothetical protein